tara:strand:+ start:84519 stop:86015 length:1497 start_codon:yes stop_codon:yes gene_type:complete
VLKRVFQGISLLIFLLIILIAVVLFRTFSFGGSNNTAPVALPTVPAFSSVAISENVSAAIQIRTITLTAGDPRPGREGPWLELEDLLERTYPDFHATAEKMKVADYTLLYHWEGSDPSLDPILLMAHQDVVPVNIGTEGDWDAPPFSGEIVGDYLYGRGTIDDKTSLITIMEAAEALVDSGFQPTRSIWIMFGHDEEVSGSGARAGVEYFESQGIEMEMVLDEGFMVVDPFPITGTTVGMIGIAEKGYVTIEITSRAAGGHSSTPPRNSANIQLARALVALDETQMPSNLSEPPMSDMIAALAADMPFMTRMAFANQWLFGSMIEGQFSADGASNAMIRTTTAPTMISGSIKENVLPQNAVALVNFRIHPSDTMESVLAHVREVISGIDGVTADISQREGIGNEASPVSPIDSRAYQTLAAVAAAAGGDVPVVPALVLGATDARWTTGISENVYRFAPAVIAIGDLSGFHGTNERIAVDNLERMATGYAQIMTAMASE